MGAGAYVAGGVALAALFGAAFALRQEAAEGTNPCQPCGDQSNVPVPPPPSFFPGSGAAAGLPAIESAVPPRAAPAPSAAPAQTAHSESKYR